MKQEINKSQFVEQFNAIRPDNFSYAGLSAFYDWLEELSEGTGEEYNLDVIALCCEFSEYESARGCVETCGYDCDFSTCDDNEEREEVALDYLRDETMLIEFEGGVIIQDF